MACKKHSNCRYRSGRCRDFCPYQIFSLETESKPNSSSAHDGWRACVLGRNAKGAKQLCILSSRRGTPTTPVGRSVVVGWEIFIADSIDGEDAVPGTRIGRTALIKPKHACYINHAAAADRDGRKGRNPMCNPLGSFARSRRGALRLFASSAVSSSFFPSFRRADAGVSLPSFGVSAGRPSRALLFNSSVDPSRAH